MNDLFVREAIDACRPGSSDLCEPEFAEVAQRVATDGQLRGAYEACQKFDVAVRDVLQDVSPPDGLAERLLAAASSAHPGEATAAVAPASRSAAAWSGSFEMLAATASIIACAAAVLVAAWYASPEPITPDQLVERSFEWKAQIDHDAWNESLKSAPRDEFPLSSRVAFAPWRWQKTGGSNSARVAYYGGPPDVLLFVVRSQNVAGLSGSPKLLSATGGWSVGAWQAGDLTYVLVVEGDRRKFESHLKTHTPV